MGTIISWCAAIVGGLAGIYGLHRLALRLEEQGHLYYTRKRPSGSAAGCFVALQRAVEPQAQHVWIVRDQVRRDLGGAAGPGDGPADAGGTTAAMEEDERPAETDP